jgi:hypothetical protein
MSETFLILKRIERDIIINLCSSSCKAAIILVRIQRKLNFLYRFLKSTQISSFMKIHPVGAKLFHADGKTDMTKVKVAFLQFCERA